MLFRENLRKQTLHQRIIDEIKEFHGKLNQPGRTISAFPNGRV